MVFGLRNNFPKPQLWEFDCDFLTIDNKPQEKKTKTDEMKFQRIKIEFRKLMANEEKKVKNK